MIIIQITVPIYPFTNFINNNSYNYNHNFINNLDKDELSKCNSENKVLITFTNLEGALILKNKGYNPTFVLVLPEDKPLYKTYIYNRIHKYYMNQNGSITENVKKTFRHQ